jgi:hypothetical protein
VENVDEVLNVALEKMALEKNGVANSSPSTAT